MKIKLHGIFARDFPGDFEIEAETVAEAIEGWSRQVGFYEDKTIDMKPLVKVVGFEEEDKLHEKTELKEIHLVPAMIGGGGNFGKILIGALLIATSIINPFNISIAFSIALFTTGVSLVLGGVMGLFMKAPTLTQSNDPDVSKYIGLSNNTTAIGTPIANCYGRISQNGHVLALNVDSSDLLTGTFPTTPT